MNNEKLLKEVSKIPQIESHLDSITNDSNISDVLNSDYKFKTGALSSTPYIWLEQTGRDDVRFAIFPQKTVTDGLGACLKLFADAFQKGTEYRDLGIYFHQNQRGNLGSNNTGAWYINSKVLEGSQYDKKNPDIVFSFQDGRAISCRMANIDDVNGNRGILLVGHTFPQIAKEYENGKNVRLEVEGDIGLKSDYLISFYDKITKTRVGSISATNNGINVDNFEIKGAIIKSGRVNKTDGTNILEATGKNLVVVANTVENYIDTITGTPYQEIMIAFNDNFTTIRHSTSKIRLNGSIHWKPTMGSTLTLLNIGGVWWEKSRMDSKVV